MSAISETQLRLVYSLLKPAVRIAARFHVPVRTVSELLRLAYYESLRSQGLSQKHIAERLGQTERNIRMFAARLKTDFFAAENEVGAVREVESVIHRQRPTRKELSKLTPALGAEERTRAVTVLLDQQRVAERSGRLTPTKRYSTLSSSSFHQRVDAVNHHLQALYAAVLNRLVYDNRVDAMIKTVSFTARPDDVRAFLDRLEVSLREDIARLEAKSDATEGESTRYSLGMSLAPEEADPSG